MSNNNQNVSYSYLGCYHQKNAKPLFSNQITFNAKQGSNYAGQKHTQESCAEAAIQNNRSHFALQGRRYKDYGNCMIGNKPNVNLTYRDSRYPCNLKCTDAAGNTDDSLFREKGIPGCGSLDRHSRLRPQSVYEVYHDNTPSTTALSTNTKYSDNYPIGQKFREGENTFNSSSYCWHHSPDRAFDGKVNTLWHSYYNDRRNRIQAQGEYDSSPYYKKTATRAIYKDERSPSIVRSRTRNVDGEPLNPKKDGKMGRPIIHETEERVLDKADENYEGIKHYGEWCEIEFPYKIIPSSFEMMGYRQFNRFHYFQVFPRRYVLLGTNGDDGWDNLGVFDSHENGTELINLYNRDRNAYLQKGKEPWTHPIQTEKSYSKFRLVIKETYGSDRVGIGNIVIKGKVCINMNGNCNEFRSSEINNSDNNVESFENMNDNEIIEESFINMKIDKNSITPINEKNIFNIGYSKY